MYCIMWTLSRIIREVVVPHHLRDRILSGTHGNVTGGHFSSKRMYGVLNSKWWWETMYADAIKYVENCPGYTVVMGTGRHSNPPLHPIPVDCPFQIMGVDIMELPKMHKGNRYVMILQDYLTKWPLVYPVADQKTQTIAKILIEEEIPFFGVPESLLSDQGTHLMKDLCLMLEITKLNTTAYHPQCDSMVERFNQTLKFTLQKHAVRFRKQWELWDSYLPSVLWGYRNTPHESTGDKPSFLMFGIDLRSPTEAAYLNPSKVKPSAIEGLQRKGDDVIVISS